MLTYKAIYKELDGGLHAEVLDFPGVITCGRDLDEIRHLLAGALVDMAKTCWLSGEPLPRPDPSRSDPDADLEEPIHLLMTAASRVSTVPDGGVFCCATCAGMAVSCFAKEAPIQNGSGDRKRAPLPCRRKRLSARD